MASEQLKSYRRYASLLLTLLAVYAVMAVLSGLDVNDQPFKPSAWRFDTPRFIVADGADGQWEFNWFNQRKILEQAAINLTLGVGMTFVILTGGIDLSVGSMLALCNVIFVRMVIEYGGDTPLAWPAPAIALLACIGAGLAGGIANGWISVGLRIPSFIVTLGTFLIMRGLAYWVGGGQTHLLACPPGMTKGVPIGISVAAVAVASVFLAFTVSGRHIYAVGGNLLASSYSGVRTGVIRVMCFAFSGLCAGLAGVIYWSRTASGSYTAGEGAELYAIAAVVLGGTRLSGGEGSIIGTMIGAMIMAVLSNGLNTASVHELTQKIIVGCVLIVAAYIDSRRGRPDASAVR